MDVDDGLTFVAQSLALVHIVYPSFGRLCCCCPLVYFNAIGANIFGSLVYHVITILAISGIVVVAVHVLLISVLMVVLLLVVRATPNMTYRFSKRSFHKRT